tara:strand:+ start:1903 stop:2073 length:171 start_codon:yes stop_codon:yes gene_type:complete
MLFSERIEKAKINTRGISLTLTDSRLIRNEINKITEIIKIVDNKYLKVLVMCNLSK